MDSEMFKQISSKNAGLVIRVDLSLLTSMFAKGETFRVVVGGAANGERVVWFDIGIGYTGGPVVPTPFDGFVVRSNMTMNFPV